MPNGFAETILARFCDDSVEGGRLRFRTAIVVEAKRNFQKKMQNRLAKICAQQDMMSESNAVSGSSAS